ncbi:MAG: DUF3047 domain-containing protein [Pseudomonadota bacterium]
MTVGSRHRIPILMAALMLSACAARPDGEVAALSAAPPEATEPLVLFTGGDALELEWRKVRVWRDASFALVPDGQRVVIGAEAEGSSAALIRRVDFDVDDCPIVEWEWRIDALAEPADLSSRRSEDTPASILFAFGDPGSLTNPDDVPTLRYAWATDTNAVGSVIDSPYFPGILRTLVVRSGTGALGTWVTERRNLREDYAQVFGGRPADDVEIMALFTDSDHGEQRAEARYASARALCVDLPDGPSIFD